MYGGIETISGANLPRLGKRTTQSCFAHIPTTLAVVQSPAMTTRAGSDCPGWKRRVTEQRELVLGVERVL
ncbi:hypothetical protein SKAU_G00093440 [Synaphobranchus kaupii]|uniref:Uncharacterized protein n=1 Tax=Synaphobranchus kaupii TaxID=118154 RepID=A0A9Q1J6P1_SYNKA|nr:hypothetical protein SKAU_G00093440 [Synaphobranchus kaupii]